MRPCIDGLRDPDVEPVGLLVIHSHIEEEERFIDELVSNSAGFGGPNTDPARSELPRLAGGLFVFQSHKKLSERLMSSAAAGGCGSGVGAVEPSVSSASSGVFCLLGWSPITVDG